MGLGRKNLLYSMALAVGLLVFLVGYFICMLPSLYVDYVCEQNLRSVLAQHRAYMECGTYEAVRVRNPTACFSVEIPVSGDYVLLTGKAFSAEVRLRDQRLREVLDRCREGLFKAWDAGAEDSEELWEELGKNLEELGEILAETGQGGGLPVSVRLRYQRDIENEFSNESVRVHTYSDGCVIVEAGVQILGDRYTNYVAMEKTEKRIIFSVLPTVTPGADEIRPVVLQSLPMLGAVIVLLTVLFSGMYSRGIVRPILELVRHAEEMKHRKDFSVERLAWKGTETGDEVRELGETLDDFYQQIRESYMELEEKNRELAEENERQEIFLRSSSHQLKTPIAAALLLVDGMLNEVGRYKDTKAYLPRVKEQLLSMRKMVEDILYLNHCARDMSIRRTDVGQVLAERLQSYQVAVADRGIHVEAPADLELLADTDEAMAARILDNLLSNAVRYTPEGGLIRIELREEGQERGILIENFGVTIPDGLMPHVFEPFVTGSHQADSAGLHSHGLGLYIASYYAKKLEARLEVRNGEDSVVTLLMFPAGRELQ